jgi:hypothetical protein
MSSVTLPGYLDGLEFCELRLIYDYLRYSDRKTFSKMELTGPKVLIIEWRGYDPNCPNRHTHCLIRMGRVHDIVLAASEIPSLCGQIKIRMVELRDALAS